MSEQSTAVEVLDVGDLTLGDLREQVIAGHEDVLRAGRDMIAAAARAGAILAQIKPRVPAGTWREWITANLPFSYPTAHLYMRCHKHEALIRENGWTKLVEVKTGIGSLLEPDHQGKGRNGKAKPEWMKEIARAMRADGASYTEIARELGVSFSAVRCWVDPEWEAKARRKVAAINKRRIRAERLLREEEQANAIKQAVKKAGGAVAEAYAMAERMQDVLAQAQREAQSSEAKAALSLAGESQRRMRDQIVRALGIA